MFYILFKFGMSWHDWFWWGYVVAVVVVLLREYSSTRRGVQTEGKMWIDAFAKLSGLLLAFATTPWWWR